MFGEFMFISALSTFYYFEGKKSIAKILLILLFSITSFLTFSRSAIFSIFLLLVYFYLKKYGNNLGTKYTLVGTDNYGYTNVDDQLIVFKKLVRLILS